MLLRSSSAPILNSWLSHSKEPQPEPEPFLHLPRTRSLSLSPSLKSFAVDPTKNAFQFVAESDLQLPPLKPKKSIPANKRKQSKNRAKVVTEQKEELKPFPVSASASTERIFSSSGLGEKFNNNEAIGVGGTQSVLQTLVVGGDGGKDFGGGGGGGGRIKGSNGGDESSFSDSNDNHAIKNTDAHYQKMIEADPVNPLVLSNYAKFLKEVRGDYEKAGEYCGKAIMANPKDADALSLYADLIWKTDKDSQRAETYFDQAVKASPDDCYVMASYARFLWDAEEDEEDEGIESFQHGSSTPNFFHGVPQHSTLTASS